MNLTILVGNAEYKNNNNNKMWTAMIRNAKEKN